MTGVVTPGRKKGGLIETAWALQVACFEGLLPAAIKGGPPREAERFDKCQWYSKASTTAKSFTPKWAAVT